jgi:hypothetical protein
MYTVVFVHNATNTTEVSRFFETKRAAIKWAKWLRSTPFCRKTLVYRGNPGELLVEEVEV